MAELVSYLSIEPHMRTFDVFTATLSPAHAGLFLPLDFLRERTICVIRATTVS